MLGASSNIMAIATELRTLRLKEVCGLRPQPGALPLHPVLTSMATAERKR